MIIVIEPCGHTEEVLRGVSCDFCVFKNAVSPTV